MNNLIKFWYFFDVSMLWSGVFYLLDMTVFLLLFMLLTSIYIKYKKLFGSVFTGDTEIMS